MKTSKRKKRLAITLLVMAVIFSVFAFCIPFKKNAVFWTAYISEILAFILQTPVFKTISKSGAKLKSKVLGIPLFSTGYLYLGIQTIVSLILFMLSTILKAFPLLPAAAVCAIVFAAALICGSTAESDTSKEEYPAQRTGNSLMKSLCMKADNIALKAYDDNSRHMLELVAESIRYSNPDSSSETREIELKLKNIITQLDRAVSERKDIVELCAEIAQLLNDRNNICKMSEQ